MRRCFLFIYSFVIVCTLVGCATTKSATSERVRTEYIHQIDTLLKHDSTYVHDSVFVTVHGDTILQYKYRTEYRDRIQYRTKIDTVNHTDTVTTTIVKSVSSPLTWFQRFTQAVGNIVIFMVLAFGIILLIRKYFH